MKDPLEKSGSRRERTLQEDDGGGSGEHPASTKHEEANHERKVAAVNMMGMMDQAHTLLHQLMMWLHQMGGMPMMHMPM